MCVSEPSIHKNKALKFSNFGHFLSHFFSIRLIRGSTYTRVYTVVVLYDRLKRKMNETDHKSVVSVSVGRSITFLTSVGRGGGKRARTRPLPDLKWRHTNLQWRHTIFFEKVENNICIVTFSDSDMVFNDEAYFFKEMGTHREYNDKMFFASKLYVNHIKKFVVTKGLVILKWQG